MSPRTIKLAWNEGLLTRQEAEELLRDCGLTSNEAETVLDLEDAEDMEVSR